MGIFREPGGSGFAQVDLGVVPDIEATGFALYLGVAADQGVGKDDIIEVGEAADDGIFQDGIIDPGLFPDGDIGTYDGVADIAARGDTDGLDDDGILELVLGRDGPAELLEQLGIGLEQRLLLTAVEPVLHFEGPELYVTADHAFDGVGEVVFPIAGDLVTDVGFQTIEKHLRFADAIDADQGHIGLGDLGLLHYPFDLALIGQFGYPEIAGIVDPFYT